MECADILKAINIEGKTSDSICAQALQKAH